MANVFAPFGARWLGLNNSPATPSDALVQRKVANADTQKLYRGDGLKSLATGYVSGIVAAGTAVSQWAGIFWGCAYLSLSQGKRVTQAYWPGADAVGDIDVQMIPLAGGIPQTFLMQASGASPIAFADIGATVDISYQAGTVTSGGWSKSGMAIPQGSLGTTVTFPWRIVGLGSSILPSGYPNTDDTSANNLVIVSFNSAQELGIL